MHPDVKALTSYLTLELLSKHNNHDAKFEFFGYFCKVCRCVTVHRFSTGDAYSRGTCEHVWGMTRADFATQEGKSHEEAQEAKHDDIPTNGSSRKDQPAT